MGENGCSVRHLIGEGPVLSQQDGLETPDLFMRFASSSESLAQMQEFVAKHGIPDFVEEGRKGEWVGEMRGCSVERLLSFARLMRLLTVLFSAIESDDLGLIAKHRKRTRELLIQYADLLTGSIEKRGKRGYLIMTRDWAREHPREAAARLISFAMTYHLCYHAMGTEGVAQVLNYHPGAGYQPPTVERVSTVAGFEQLVFTQFSNWIDRGKQIGVCCCGRLFPKTRSDKAYCSDSCSARVRMKRKRDLDRAASRI